MTRAAGTTLPLRTYKQMFKTIRPKDILDPTKNIKLVAYKVHQTSTAIWRKPFTQAKVYVVDVPSPPIAGLPICEKIGLVTIHCDDLNAKIVVTIVEGLEQAHPGQFDTLGDFKGPTKLYFNQD